MVKNEKHIHIKKAGTLKKLLSEKEKMKITHLKVSGFLNSDDFFEFDEMCSSEVSIDEYDYHTVKIDEPPFLTHLDLGECVFTDIPYIGEFTYYSKLKEVILPKNTEATANFGVFENSRFLTKVVVPDTFTSFGNGTFSNCESLVEINFPEKLERIGIHSFSNCTSLPSIKIPANVSSIDGSAFFGCDRIEKFEIDEANQHFTVIVGVIFNKEKTKIIAFPSGSKVKHYNIPDGVKIIGKSAFSSAEIESISLPDSLEVIEEDAFGFCINLTKLDIPDSVTEIGEQAFKNCVNLQKISLSKNITILRRLLFAGCRNLKVLEVPSSVKIIDEVALGWAYNLENLILNEGLIEIKDDFKLTKIRKLKIPKTVEKIQSGLPIFGDSVFHKFEYDVNEDNPNFKSIDGSLYSKDMSRLIAIFPKNKTSFKVPFGVKIIEDFVFSYVNIEEIILPNTVTSIKHRCFEHNKILKKVILPSSLQQIDFRAFDECVNLGIIEIEAKTPPEITNYSSTGWKFAADSKKLSLIVPKESLKIYKKTSGWKDLLNI